MTAMTTINRKMRKEKGSDGGGKLNWRNRREKGREEIREWKSHATNNNIKLINLPTQHYTINMTPQFL